MFPGLPLPPAGGFMAFCADLTARGFPTLQVGFPTCMKYKARNFADSRERKKRCLEQQRMGRYSGVWGQTVRFSHLSQDEISEHDMVALST